MGELCPLDHPDRAALAKALPRETPRAREVSRAGKVQSVFRRSSRSWWQELWITPSAAPR